MGRIGFSLNLLCLIVWFMPNSNAVSTGTVRLYRNGVPDTSQSWSSGIVQIYYDYEWGNICDDYYFGSDEANVICHQLDYTGASTYSNTGYTTTWGTDSSSSVLSQVSCSSSSYLTITQCSFSTPSYGCSNDVTVTCYTTRIWDFPSPGDIRLTGGTYSNQGLLEVYCNGQWGTVCDDSFHGTEARIACKQLGYNYYSNYDQLYMRGNYSQSIWLQYLSSCSSYSDTCLTSCGSCPSSGVTGCSHSEDITLTCEYSSSISKVSTTTTSDCQSGAEIVSTGTVRLYRNGVPDTTQSWSSGIVQIYYSGSWGNICDDYSFGSDEADVICHQLGYTGASSYSNTGYIATWSTDYSSTVMDDVSCSSSSYLTITQCSFSTSISSFCTDNTDVTVSCYTAKIWSSPIPGDIRLTGGTYSNQGLLEVYCNGQWGTVCDDEFYSTEARVACKQLGYNYYSDYDHLDMRGNYSETIWLQYLSSCSSYSDTCLTSCGSCPSSGVTGCSHSEDITLTCEYSQYYTASTAALSSTCFTNGREATGTVRLYRNGTADISQSLSSGIVQIYYSSQWGNICDDSSFGFDEADVICHQLGYSGASSYSNTGSTTTVNIWGRDSSPTVMDDVSCSSSSYLTITQCSFSTSIKSSCDNTNDAIVSCYSTRIWSSPSTGDIRLTGGTYTNQGLLEVYCNDEWGTVCDYEFYSTEARVACRQLGYNGYLDYGELSIQGSSSQSIWMKYFNAGCSSSDSCLTSCGSCAFRSISSCGHYRDVTLECEYSSSNSNVDTDTSSTCDTSTISTSVIIGIAIGSVIFFIVCIVSIISIPICICVCLGVGIGAVRGRPYTRVVSRHYDTSSESQSTDEAVPFINYAADDNRNDETPLIDNEQQSTTTATTTGHTAPQTSGVVPPPAASGYPPPNPCQPAAVYPPPSGYPTAGYSTQPACSTTAGQLQYHPAAVTVLPPGQNPPPPPHQQQQPAGNTSHVVYPPAAFN